MRDTGGENTDVICNIEAEAALLGALLMENDLIDRAADVVDVEDFSFALHGRIFSALLYEFAQGKKVTPVTLRPYFDGDDDIKDLGGVGYLARLTADAAGLLAFKELCAQIADLGLRRRMQEGFKAAVAACSDMSTKIGDIIGQADAAMTISGKEEIHQVSGAECFDEVLTGFDDDGAGGVLCGSIGSLDGVLGAIRPKQLIIGAGRPGMGKAQPLDAKVLTQWGWTTMGNLRVGDQLASVNGDLSVVMGVYPQGEQQLYRVTFSDGRSTECCAEHLWCVRYRDWDAPRVLSTDRLAEMLTRSRYKGRLSIDLINGQWGSSSPLPLDPWLLGILIGDGNICSGHVRFSSADPEIVERVSSLMPEGLRVSAAGGVDYRISGGQRGGKPNQIKDALSALGLFGLGGHEKYIPLCYLNASAEQRWELLRGLMDSDGWAEKFGAIRFSSVSERLSHDVQYLVRSLGGVCSIRANVKSYAYKGEKKQGRVAYTCKIRMQNGQKAFSLKRKVERAKRISNTVRLSIKSIEQTRVDQAQCILVSHPSRLYVTDDFIVTHNTAVAISYAIGAARRGHGVLFISLEMSSHELGMRMASDLCFDLGEHDRVPFAAIQSGTINDRQRDAIRRARGYVADLPLFVVDAGSMTIGRLNMLVRRYARRLEAKGQKLELVIVDYLQLLHPDQRHRSAYENVSEVSRGLKACAKENGVGVFALAQLSREVEKREDKRPMLSDLRDSGQIEQDADGVLFLLRQEYYLLKNEPDPGSDKHETWRNLLERNRGKIEFIVAKRRNGVEGYSAGRFFGPYQAVR